MEEWEDVLEQVLAVTAAVEMAMADSRLESRTLTKLNCCGAWQLLGSAEKCAISPKGHRALS